MPWSTLHWPLLVQPRLPAKVDGLRLAARGDRPQLARLGVRLHHQEANRAVVERRLVTVRAGGLEDPFVPVVADLEVWQLRIVVVRVGCDSRQWVGPDVRTAIRVGTCPGLRKNLAIPVVRWTL